jgi:Copper transport outer membrane protein, MctB
MVDFRYLLITVVAIFLALTIGILMGSGFFAEPIRKDLEGRVQAVKRTNAGLLDENDELERVIGQDNRFAEAIEPYLVDDALQGRQVVLITFEGADGSALEDETTALEQAAADLISTITITQKLELADAAASEELGGALDSTESNEDALRRAAASALGTRAAAAAEDAPGETRDLEAVAHFEETLGDLERAGFITVDRKVEGQSVPPAALFLIVGGSTDAAPFDVASFTTALATGLASRDARVVVTEPSDSRWGLVASVREDGDAGTLVSTVDDAERVEGRIATVLAFSQPSVEPPGHYGIEDGATGGVIPEPVPGG